MEDELDDDECECEMMEPTLNKKSMGKIKSYLKAVGAMAKEQKLTDNEQTIAASLVFKELLKAAYGKWEPRQVEMFVRGIAKAAEQEADVELPRLIGYN